MKKTGFIDKIPLTGTYALIQAGGWMSFCVAVSYSAVYLQMLSFSNTGLGAVMACGNLLGAGLGMELSAQIDRSSRVTPMRLIPPVLAVQTAMLFLLQFLAGENLVTAVAYVCYVASTVIVNSLNLKIYADVSHCGGGVNYGLARGMGSAAYVLLSVLLGQLVKTHTARILPTAGLVLCAVQMIAFLLMKRRMPEAREEILQTETAETGSTIVAFLHGNRSFGIVLIGTVLLFFAHNIVGNYMINVTRNVGGDAGSMGVINGFMAMMEIPVMMLYQQLFGRKNPAGLLRVAFVCFAVKAFAIAMAESVPSLMASLALQAPSFALYTTAIVPYVEHTIPYKDSAKAQSLAFNMTTLGSVLASLLGGALYDMTSVGNALWTAAAIAVIGMLVGIPGLQNGREKQRHSHSGQTIKI